MPGTISGSVDHRSNTTASYGINQEYFTNLYRFFNGPLRSGGYVELVALQTGSAAAGTDFWDEGPIRGTHFGENAFVCWRLRSGSVSGSAAPTGRRSYDVYYLFQWASAAGTFGASPGNPGLNEGSSAVKGTAMAVAWRDDGGNPWNGTTLANGNDSKGAVVWTSGSSTVRVFPRSNNSGGSHNSLKENMHGLTNGGLSTATSYRYHFLHDRDSFFSTFDSGDSQTYDALTYAGTFEPLPGFTSGSAGTLPMPMIMLNASTYPFPVGTTIGDTAGTGGSNGGGVGPRLSGGVQVRAVRIDRYTNNLLANTSLEPNSQFVANRFDEFKVPVMIFESPDFGLLGFVDMLTEVYNAGSHDVTSGSTKAVFTSAGGAVGYILPWSGSAPGSTSTRQGRQF